MKKKKPNLIYVFADQLRYFSLGYAGDERALTPNIDRLQAESTDLCQAVSGHPVCAPYRASLFTGKYTTSTGMVINEIRMNTNHHTFADVLMTPKTLISPRAGTDLALTITLQAIISGMNMRWEPPIIIWTARKKSTTISMSRTHRWIWRLNR